MNLRHAYFITHPTGSQIVLYACLLTFLWLTEAYFSAISVKAKLRHTSTNLLFIASSLPVQLLMTIFLVRLTIWTALHHWGILYHLPFSNTILVKYVLGFIVLDFCEYVYHVVMHKVKPLWKFHLVHHTDLKLDVSSTVREHPGETFCRVCFLMLWVFITGAGFWLLLLRQTFQTLVNVSSHSELRLGPKSEKWLSMLFITPNMHQVHHHYELPFTDSNYGDVLSWWDRLFGTYRVLEPEDTVFGLDTHYDPVVCENFINTIKIPFVKRKT